MDRCNIYDKNKNRYGKEDDGFVFDHFEPEVLNIQAEILIKYMLISISGGKFLMDIKIWEITCIQILTVIEIMKVNTLAPIKKTWWKKKRA